LQILITFLDIGNYVIPFTGSYKANYDTQIPTVITQYSYPFLCVIFTHVDSQHLKYLRYHHGISYNISCYEVNTA